jgi:hypothetical protein
MKRFVYLCYGFVLLMVSCKGTGMQGDGLVSSSGRSSEVLAVCTDAAWKGALGDSLRAVLEEAVVGLPQTEPMFRLSRTTPDHFGPIYQKQRNILMFNVDADATSPRLVIEKNKWAKPQVCITLSAPCADSLASAFSLARARITAYLLQGEMLRFQRAQRAQQDARLNSLLQKTCALSMVFPEGFYYAVRQPDFCWLRKETKYWGQHVMVYTEPYRSEQQFSPEYIAALRNRHTQRYVKGSADSSRAQIDDRFYPVTYAPCTFPNTPYAVEARGLWGLFGHPGDLMGGPFVSYTLLDTAGQRVVTLDGFLYAPSDPKRDLLRQLEAILMSMQYPDSLGGEK